MPHSPAKPFSGIFVSYRRDDSSGHAGRLSDKLVDHFGKDRIFMDIDTIEPGEDFVTVIENAVSSCGILIAVIGRNWLAGSSGATGPLDNPNDFVRLEIAAALERDIRVIPVLVQRAIMPKSEDLPESLAKLARRNAVELSDLRWQNDVDQLVGVMERVLAKREEQERERLEEEQRRVEKTRQLQLEEEAAAQRAAEERRREETEEETRRVEKEKQLRLADEANHRAAEDRLREAQGKERAEAEERAKEEAQAASRRRAEEECVRTEAEDRRIAEEEAERLRVQAAQEAERQRVGEEALHPEQQTAPPLDTALFDGVATQRESSRKRTMTFVVISCVVLLGIVGLIWMRQTLKGEQPAADDRGSTQLEGQTTSRPAATAASPSITPTPIPASAIATGNWDGEWSDSKGTFSCELKLVQDSQNKMSGSIVWTLRKTRLAGFQKRIGLSGIEHVTGTFQQSERLLNLRGYRKNDPHVLIALDRYRLVLSPDGSTLAGQSQLQKGRLSAVRKN